MFQVLLQQRMPVLAAHLDAHGLGDLPSLFLPRWLLCVFLNCFPVHITVRVWDALIIEGAQVREGGRDTCSTYLMNSLVWVR